MGWIKTVFEGLGIAGGHQVTGDGYHSSAFRVTDMALATMASVGRSIVELRAAMGQGYPGAMVEVDRGLASHWFKGSIRPVGWSLPPVWDDIAGDYQTRDGWIKLHTNAAHHKAAALQVLGVSAEKASVAEAVARWDASELEAAIAQAGGVAAEMRSAADWARHPQGRAVAKDPFVTWSPARKSVPRSDWQPTADRPLAGLRVLDLTRILAGPIATRTLAGFGAEVLRIDPVDWDEPNVAPEVTLGKRCARLDLRSDTGREAFRQLLRQADVLVHGYRPDALEGLGLGRDWRLDVAPHGIEVQINAYGWTGPWSGRRGYDSLVQMSSGIAHSGMLWANSDGPNPLPVQALDHSTGYAAASAAIVALRDVILGKGARDARLSLARTAQVLLEHPATSDQLPALASLAESDFSEDLETTPWGPAKRLRPAISVEGAPMFWDRPACKLGSSEAVWS